MIGLSMKRTVRNESVALPFYIHHLRIERFGERDKFCSSGAPDSSNGAIGSKESDSFQWSPMVSNGFQWSAVNVRPKLIKFTRWRRLDIIDPKASLFKRVVYLFLTVM